MAVGKLISVFLIDGVPDGRLVGEISNWTGKALKIPRGLLKASAGRDELQKAGVYFLFGQAEDNPDEDAVYIGESEEVGKRFSQHGKSEFWREVVVFTSKDENLNKAHVKYLESKLYEMAVAAKRFSVLNPSKPTCPALSESEQAVMSEFLSNMRLLVNTLGYKVLEPLAEIAEKQRDLFVIKGARGADARAVVTHEGVVVLEGSGVADPIAPSMSPAFAKARQRLIDNGVIGDRQGRLAFIEDCLFASPSAAAAVVMGRNANGRTELKDAKGKTLRDREGY